MTQVKVESDNTDLLPRKQPTQGRSRKTVEKILAATRIVLERDGHRSLTTISVAEESGVTVGSIYQYFPTKHAIVYALYTNWLDDLVARIDHVLAGRPADASAQDVLREVYVTASKETMSGRLTKELSAAMSTHPELIVVEAAHQQRITQRIAALLSELSPHAPPALLNQFATGLYKLSNVLMDVVGDTPPSERDAIQAWVEATANSAVLKLIDLTNSNAQNTTKS